MGGPSASPQQGLRHPAWCPLLCNDSLVGIAGLLQAALSLSHPRLLLPHPKGLYAAQRPSWGLRLSCS